MAKFQNHYKLKQIKSKIPNSVKLLDCMDGKVMIETINNNKISHYDIVEKWEIGQLMNGN